MIIEQRNNNLRLLERSIYCTHVCDRYISYIHEKDEALRQQTSQSALNIHKYIEGCI